LKLYRIVKEKYAEEAFSGIGAKEFGGRWNSPGKELIYAAESASLALLEILVHTHSEDMERFYSVFEVDVPDNLISRVERDALPRGWNSLAPGKASQDIGDNWLDNSNDVALLVPSAVNPHDWNALINPLHEQWPGIMGACARLDNLYPDFRLKM
jgi:RES domain-containing protein